jgi:hypothetical protein
VGGIQVPHMGHIDMVEKEGSPLLFSGDKNINSKVSNTTLVSIWGTSLYPGEDRNLGFLSPYRWGRTVDTVLLLMFVWRQVIII